MTRAWKAWLISFAATAAIAWLSIIWLDRPIALWVRDVFGERHVPLDVIESHLLSVPLLSACMFILCGLAAIAGRRPSKLEAAIALCTISSLAAIVIKDQLKIVFGRTWPDTWAPGILSLVHDGVYGFNFFHSGKSFESFPSGHATIVAAILSVLWLVFPELRLVWAICIVAVDCGLVALNLHFLSDVIAGSFTGFSVGLFTISLWRAIGFALKE
jgi:membrane-associated phospholipid phosphatase